MQRTIKIIVVWLVCLFYASDIHAQSSVTKQQLPPTGNYLRLTHLADDSAGNINRSINTLVSSDYYTRHFGFFCNKEFKLEKSTGIPFRFRLGSMENCNKLEGKK